MPNCSRPECQNDAAYSIGLELRAKANTRAALAAGILYVCEEHKDVEWGDIIQDEGWNTICRQFEKAGYMRPVRQFSNIRLFKLE